MVTNHIHAMGPHHSYIFNKIQYTFWATMFLFCSFPLTIILSKAELISALISLSKLVRSLSPTSNNLKSILIITWYWWTWKLWIQCRSILYKCIFTCFTFTFCFNFRGRVVTESPQWWPNWKLCFVFFEEGRYWGRLMELFPEDKERKAN